MPDTKEWIGTVTDDIYLTNNAVLAIFIAISIAIGKSIGYIFNTDTCN